MQTQWNYTIGAVYKHYRENGYNTLVASRNMLNNRAYKYLNNDESDASNLILITLPKRLKINSDMKKPCALVI